MRPIVFLSLILAACTPRVGEVEEGEWLPGDVATNTLLLGGNAFLRPASNLTPEHEGAFYGGNSFFNDNWVEAPASTQNRDGLGPLFNARSCSGCHFRDGRAQPPEEGDGAMEGLLFRLSGADGGAERTYGEQLQDVALPGLEPEGRVRIERELISGTFDDGTTYELEAPTYHLDMFDGALEAGATFSPRIAPQMIGLGLLEAIPVDDLLSVEDPDDRDGDGISGRAQWVVDVSTGETMLGRFGWKADAPTVLHQSAAAFNGDIGITSPLFPSDDCTEAQTACRGEPSGGAPEIEMRLLERVTIYSQAVAVPIRRSWDDEEVLRGKYLFGDIGCASCHTPSHTTGEGSLDEFAGLRIWPYTDLLLHDMGPGLADGRPLGEADGQEWKTPPLWGLGLVPDVNGHTRYLHDGRARSLEEAVLWHGGEAEEARVRYGGLDPVDREALLRFLRSL